MVGSMEGWDSEWGSGWYGIDSGNEPQRLTGRGGWVGREKEGEFRGKENTELKKDGLITFHPCPFSRTPESEDADRDRNDCRPISNPYL